LRHSGIHILELYCACVRLLFVSSPSFFSTMSFQLITEKPLWFILLCLLLGAAYAFVLYGNDTSLNEVHPWLKKMMAVLRFLLVSLLAFLLLSPLIKNISYEKEKPIVIIAQDNSESIVVNKDSAFY